MACNCNTPFVSPWACPDQTDPFGLAQENPLKVAVMDTRTNQVRALLPSETPPQFPNCGTSCGPNIGQLPTSKVMQDAYLELVTRLRALEEKYCNCICGETPVPCPEPTPCPECPECPEVGAAVPTWFPSFPNGYTEIGDGTLSYIYRATETTVFNFTGTPQIQGFVDGPYGATPPPVPQVGFVCDSISTIQNEAQVFVGGILGDPTGVTWAIRWEINLGDYTWVADTAYTEPNYAGEPQAALNTPNVFTSSYGHQVIVTGGNITLLVGPSIGGGGTYGISKMTATASRAGATLGILVSECEYTPY